MTDYFHNVIGDFFSESIDCEGRIAVIGAGLPPELIYCADSAPIWILSGSPADARGCDTVPKDADDMSRSIIGLLSSGRLNIEKLAAMIVLISDDNSRKLAFEMSEHCRVITVDLPAMYQASDRDGYWRKSVLRLYDELDSIRSIKRGSIRGAVDFTNSARRQISRLVSEAERHPSVISFSECLTVVNSLFCSHCKEEWLRQLTALNDILQYMKPDEDHPTDPDILLIGSPVYYPNHKLLRLFSETGLRLRGTLSPVMQLFFDDEMKKRRTDFTQLCTIGERSIGNIVLSEYLGTDYVSGRLADELERIRPKGVVFHVIRGRKTEDADSQRFERQCEYRGISFFKIETDYQENDIEQLRLRLEAFREILV